MIFTRQINQDELEILGPDPEAKLHGIIDAALKRLQHVEDQGSVENRILFLMSPIKPMNARQIFEAHNIMYPNQIIKIEYVRVVMSGMFSAGLIKRVGRGNYVKGTN